jgi:DNA-binding NarL/FixJ family response regulator
MTALVSVAEDAQVDPITVTLRARVNPATFHLVWTLTPREVDVLQAAADGLTDREIGRRLHVGARTIGSHLANVNRKLGTHSRLQAVLVAVRAGAVKL